MDPSLYSSFCSLPTLPYCCCADFELIEPIGDFQDILPDTTWLKRWQKIPAASTATPEIPPSACVISTLLSPRAWTEMLASHSNQQLVHFFLDGISNGFRLGFNHTQSTLKSAGKNLPAAMAQ